MEPTVKNKLWQSLANVALLAVIVTVSCTILAAPTPQRYFADIMDG